MFESLTQRLSGTIDRLRGRGRLTEENIRESLREVRIALLEADVALPVVQALIQRIKVRAVGQDVMKSLSPGQALVKVVSDELTVVMGTANTGQFGSIEAGQLESSNTSDTTAQLVNMIQAQRSYQANAQVLSTDNTLSSALFNAVSR